MIDDWASGQTVERATMVISDHPEIEKWVNRRHSIGSWGGCAYAGEHTDTIDGVGIMGGDPPDSLESMTK